MSALMRIVEEIKSQGPVCLAILGLQGSGKTTLASYLASAFDGTHIETGQIARRISRDSAATGAYAPEQEFQAAFRAEIDKALYLGSPIVVEGFPRYVSQLVYAEMVLPHTHYIWLDTPPLTCIQRLVQRGRTDDTPELIANKLIKMTPDLDLVRRFIGDSMHVMPDNRLLETVNVLERIADARALGNR